MWYRYSSKLKTNFHWSFLLPDIDRYSINPKLLCILWPTPASSFRYITPEGPGDISWFCALQQQVLFSIRTPEGPVDGSLRFFLPLPVFFCIITSLDISRDYGLFLGLPLPADLGFGVAYSANCWTSFDVMLFDRRNRYSVWSHYSGWIDVCLLAYTQKTHVNMHKIWCINIDTLT